MDIKELDKKQLVLLTLLITFVVSIATGIVTVSLMNQAPKSVPQTINNVIQRTIEKVTTVETPTKINDTKEVNNNESQSNFVANDANVLIPIFPWNDNVTDSVDNNSEVKEIGQGVLISDIGLLLVDNNILTGATKYKVTLDKIDFEAAVLKKFDNGFAILKISKNKTEVKPVDEDTPTDQSKTN